MHLETCVNCGRATDELIGDTGWCGKCSGKIKCQRCGTWFPSKTKRPYCATCKQEIWLENNADAIEIYMLQGIEFHDAWQRVSIDNQNSRHCVKCGDHLPKVGLFCKKPECRNAYTRFYKRIKRGKDVETALREALAHGT